MISRISFTSKGSDFSRAMVRVTASPGLPRICLTASVTDRPSTLSPLTAVMKSPGFRPALAAGVSSMGEMIFTTPSSVVTTRPRPPYSPRVWSRMSSKPSGVEVVRVRVE